MIWDLYDESFGRAEDTYIDVNRYLTLPPYCLSQSFIGHNNIIDSISNWHTTAQIDLLLTNGTVTMDQLDTWLGHQVRIPSLVMAMNKDKTIVFQMNKNGA